MAGQPGGKVDGLTLRQMLIEGAGEFGIGLAERHADDCLLYLSELKKWNRKMNLTAIREDRDVIIKHFLDSLAFLKGFESVPGMRLLDMGSGAGFPAIPIKIVHPEMIVTMVESVKKKASFLRHIIRTLGLSNAEVVDRRTEDLAVERPAQFDVVTARAFAEMGEALASAAPFLKPGGLLVLSRGPEEAMAEQETLSRGFSIYNKIPLTLPHSDFRRVIWSFKKQ